MEILVAMVLLVGGVVAIMSSFVSSARLTNNNYGPAYNYGRGLMEQMKEEVQQNTWNAAGRPLSLTAPAQFPTTNINGVPCTSNYAVNPNNPGTMIDANGDGEEDYRVVRMGVACQ